MRTAGLDASMVTRVYSGGYGPSLTLLEGGGVAAAALIEPLSCAVHGMRRLGSVVGEDVLVMGAGTMGLLLMQLLNRAGARSVSVVDRKASRLDAATATGEDSGSTRVASSTSPA